MQHKVLIVDDEPFTIQLMLTILEDDGYELRTASNGQQALELIESFRPRLVILDYMMPLVSGREVLEATAGKYPETFFVMVTGRGSEEVAVETLKLGAIDYIAKPFGAEQFRLTVQDVLRRTEQIVAERSEQQRLVQENLLLQAQLAKGQDFEVIGADSSMREVFDRIDRIAREDVTVMIRGESGTGKELVARALHARSQRRKKPMLTVNCAALTETLIEAELFGHERGAFTGAIMQRIGKFELADGGTLFLDEIGDMSPPTQAKVLRVLQERTFERVGGTTTIKTDIRIITATHRNLEQMVREGKFREDLFYRINVHPIRLPALRERKSDVPLLFQYYVDKFCSDFSRVPIQITPELKSYIQAYHWPGNVRELRNVVERMVMLSDGKSLPVTLLPDEILSAVRRQEDSPDDELTLKEAINRVKERIVRQTLERCNWNRTRAAKALDISVRHVQNIIKEFDIRQASG
jgi:two-component system, NtrC family, nitrogen regulation response regulator NtrX